jgi:hypothetical protein
LYLPLAATHLFTCLIIFPLVFRRAKKIKDEENRDKTRSASRVVMPAQQRYIEKRKQHQRSSYIPTGASRKDRNSSTYILVASLSIMALCAGLSSRMNASTSLATTLGLQILFGIGAGLGASQFTLFGFDWGNVLSPPPDTSQEQSMVRPNLAIFAEMVGGSIGTAAAQAVFTRLLRQQIPINSDLSLVLSAGATTFRENLSGEALERALAIINTAITRSFFVAAAAGALPIGLPIAFGAILLAIAVTPLGWCFAALFWQRYRNGKGEPLNIAATITPAAQAGMPKPGLYQQRIGGTDIEMSTYNPTQRYGMPSVPGPYEMPTSDWIPSWTPGRVPGGYEMPTPYWTPASIPEIAPHTDWHTTFSESHDRRESVIHDLSPPW